MGKPPLSYAGEIPPHFAPQAEGAAITEIKKTKVVFNIEPRMKMLGLGLSGASMEAEAVDSVTSERILAVVDSQSVRRRS